MRQNLLSAIQTAAKNTEPRVTVEDIESYQPDNLTPYQQNIYQQVERLNSGLPALSNATYFPSAGSSINKGSYSGPTIGSVPIFAPDNLVPFGIYGARNEMKQQALMQKAKAIDDFYNLAKPPQTTRFSVQGQLDQMYYSGLNQWIGELENRYGSDWAQKANQDLQFQQWTESMRTIARYNTGLVEKKAELLALDNSKDYVVSGQTKRAMMMVDSGINGIDDPNNPFGHILGQFILQQYAESDLDSAVNSAIDQYVDQAYSSNPSQYSNGIYDVWTETKIHGMSEAQVKKLADGIWVNSYGGSSEIFTKQMIEDRLRALYPVRAQKAVEFQTNQFSGADGSQISYDQNAISPEADIVIAKDWSKGTMQNSYVTTTSGQVFKNAINLTVPVGVRYYDPDNNLKGIDLAGNENVTIGKTFNVLVDNRGMIYKGDPNKIPLNERANYSYETFASGVIKRGTTSDTQSSATGTQSSTSTQNVTQTVWIPVSSIQSGLVSQVAPDGTVLKGARIDIQRNQAVAATQQFRNAGLQRSYAPDGRMLGADGLPMDTVTQGGIKYTWDATLKDYK
jgi:hypothetical protein